MKITMPLTMDRQPISTRDRVLGVLLAVAIGVGLAFVITTDWSRV